MSKLKTIINEIKLLNVVEVVELVSMLEEEFGVSAESFAGSNIGGTTKVDDSKKKEEQSSFKVELIDVGTDKMKVIKALRVVKKELGLMEAKSASENLPYIIYAEANKDDSENAKKILEEAGAKVKLS